MITSDTFRRGLHKELFTTWELAKVVVPVYILVTFLKYLCHCTTTKNNCKSETFLASVNLYSKL